MLKRGHRLVTDDAVEIRKISDETLIGSAPGVTKYFIELRGIGIIDVKTLFGVESVKEEQQIDMVIKLEDWNKDKEYDRLGLEEEYTEYLGNKVVCHSLPIRPGRNLAVIVEAAAVNHRQKKKWDTMRQKSCIEEFKKILCAVVMTMSKTIFGIDIGGSTIKCGVFDGERAELVIKEEIPTRTQENAANIFYMI